MADRRYRLCIDSPLSGAFMGTEVYVLDTETGQKTPVPKVRAIKFEGRVKEAVLVTLETYLSVVRLRTPLTEHDRALLIEPAAEEEDHDGAGNDGQDGRGA